MIANMELDVLFLSFMLYSFLGWLYETTVCSLWESGHFLNRGSLLGPCCPVYGGGAVIGLVLAYYIPNPVMLFFTSAFLCICCEYLCGAILEDIFHVKLWDYTGMAFQFKGRVCLLGFLFFGTAVVVISRFVQPLVLMCFSSVRPELLTTTAVVLAVLLAADTILSAAAFSRKSRRLYRFYIRWHAMLNREFRSLSYAIQRKLPDPVLEHLSETQAYILEKNHSLAQRQAEYQETLKEKWDNFRNN